MQKWLIITSSTSFLMVSLLIYISQWPTMKTFDPILWDGNRNSSRWTLLLRNSITKTAMQKTKTRARSVHSKTEHSLGEEMSPKTSQPLENQSPTLLRIREEKRKDVSRVVGRDTSSVSARQDGERRHPHPSFLILPQSLHQRSYEQRLDISESQRLVLKTKTSRETNREYELNCRTYS